MISQSLRVVWRSSANAYADMRAMYTWRSWVFGWLMRMLAQVTFFASVGYVVGNIELVRYLVIGNALMTCAVESMMVVASSTWERDAGTMPLLVSAPAQLGWVLFGRSLQWVVSGCLTSSVSLLMLSPVFGAGWRPARVPAIIGLVVLTSLSTYCFGLFLGTLVLAVSAIRNVVSNAVYLLMMVICGVQVPVTFWPEWVRAVAWVLPLTHTLTAVRLLFDEHSSAWSAVRPALGGLLLGCCWLTSALVSMRLFVRHGRSTGTVEYFG